MLFVALSALQGRPMQTAFDELARLADGVQLTPGNLPTEGFAAHVSASKVPTRRHHGFSWDARKRGVWGDDGHCLVDVESVHPPERVDAAALQFDAHLRRGEGPILEVMYPTYCLGDGRALEEAMDAARPLAVDVSHAFIQRHQGVLGDATWRRLQAYAHVAEVHLSENDGVSDRHAPLRRDTFGLAWARAQFQAGIPVILECYMHRLSYDDRRRQIDTIRERT